MSSYNNKPKKFTPKTHESRHIPLSGEVVLLLKEWRKQSTSSRWIFPNQWGDPDGHHLRKFKKLVFRAGLNCGHCHREERKPGETCAVHPEGCERHYLHRLRKTKATFWHQRGIPLRNIQVYLGHKSLATTQRYLGIQHTHELQEQINAADF